MWNIGPDYVVEIQIFLSFLAAVYANESSMIILVTLYIGLSGRTHCKHVA